MRGYRATLLSLGHEVTSSWLNEADYGDNGISMDYPVDFCAFAEQDCRDIDRADCFMAFTEGPGGAPRGGRHVEYGIAIAKLKTLFVIGHRENAFHHLPHVIFLDSFEHWVKTWGNVMQYPPVTVHPDIYSPVVSH